MYGYFAFFGRLARGPQKGIDFSIGKRVQEMFEFYENGEWVKDEQDSTNLCDAMMDYGDYSIGDYQVLTEEEAQECMRTGKVWSR